MADPPSRASATGNLNEAARGQIATVNVMLPATVVSYDEPTQVATVKIVPCFRRRDPSQGNAVVCYAPPNIPGIPVAFPGAGDYSITWPLAEGSVGVLMICDRSIDEWKSTGDPRTEPQDARRHDLTDGVFLPAARSPADPIPADGVDSAAMVIRGPTIKLGSASASSAVALAPLVSTDLTTLETALATAAAAAVSAAFPGDGGAVAFGAFASSLVSTLALWPSSLGASKVVAE